MARRGPNDTSSKQTRAAQLSSATPRPPTKVALAERPRCSGDFGGEVCPKENKVKTPDVVGAGVIELRNLPVFLYGSAGELSVPPTARLAGR